MTEPAGRQIELSNEEIALCIVALDEAARALSEGIKLATGIGCRIPGADETVEKMRALHKRLMAQ